jgi:tryptophanyl-tRNA synthetase
MFKLKSKRKIYGLTKPTKSQLPQSKLRKVASFSKNAIRIVAFGFLAYYEIQAAAVLLVVAELIAVAEQAA